MKFFSTNYEICNYEPRHEKETLQGQRLFNTSIDFNRLILGAQNLKDDIKSQMTLQLWESAAIKNVV